MMLTSYAHSPVRWNENTFTIIELRTMDFLSHYP